MKPIKKNKNDIREQNLVFKTIYFFSFGENFFLSN